MIQQSAIAVADCKYRFHFGNQQWPYNVTPLPSSSSTTTVSSYPIDIPLNFAIPTGQYVMVSTSVAPNANTAWVATVIGGDY